VGCWERPTQYAFPTYRQPHTPRMCPAQKQAPSGAAQVAWQLTVVALRYFCVTKTLTSTIGDIHHVRTTRDETAHPAPPTPPLIAAGW
jgi:hypothetical protein